VTATFTSTDDTQIDQGSPATNHGAETSFSVDNRPVKHGLLRFSVDVGTGSIQSVKLRLYCVNASSVGGSIFGTSPADPYAGWVESTVTWDTAPAISGTSWATLGAVKAGTWYEVDLSALVASNGTYSLRITTTAANGADYATKEMAGSFAPQLVVTVG
jgi:hypothetical protein